MIIYHSLSQDVERTNKVRNKVLDKQENDMIRYQSPLKKAANKKRLILEN